MDYRTLIREELRHLRPYFPDRYREKQNDPVWIDANENPYSQKWGRYPSPVNARLQQEVSLIRDFPADQIFLSHGSDEAIDLIIRTFCTPQQDAVSVLSPAFEMYAHAARIAAVKVNTFQMEAPYRPGAELADEILDTPGKVLFLCSPNNPTGNLMPEPFMQKILDQWPGIIVIDEAYIDFAEQPSKTALIANHPNLVVMQTFSKAFGLAALRIGMTFAQKWIIDTLEAVKMPYNVSQASCEIALDLLQQYGYPETEIRKIIDERKKLESMLSQFSFVEQVYPSDANFLLVKCTDAAGLYHWLKERGIFVRLRKEPACKNCLRITVGTPSENTVFLTALENYMQALQNQES